MSRRLSYRHKGGGIAISLPVTGLQNLVARMIGGESGAPEVSMEDKIKERVRKDMSEVRKKSKYTVIWVSVASGYSDDVVDVAREAGARGGTVMKGRRRSSERAGQHLGIALHDDRDADREKERSHGSYRKVLRFVHAGSWCDGSVGCGRGHRSG